MHETLASFRKVSVSSNRWFGFAFAGIFFVLAIWPWIFHRGEVRWPFAVVAMVLALAAELFPSVLAPLNQGWFKLGTALNEIVNPIFMGLMFYGAVVPFGLFLRSKDLLRLKTSHANETFWIQRDPPGPLAESLKKQF